MAQPAGDARLRRVQIDCTRRTELFEPVVLHTVGRDDIRSAAAAAVATADRVVPLPPLRGGDDGGCHLIAADNDDENGRAGVVMSYGCSHLLRRTPHK